MSVPPLRAPREHGSIFASPPLAEVGALLAANHTRLESSRLRLLGRPLPALRQLARRDALHAAHAYFDATGEPIPAGVSDRWLLAGHQPELFHPGVWFKNFALAALARKHGAFSLNLVVDNDTAKSTTLRLPDRDHVTQIAFDKWQGEVPYEERTVLDEALFASVPGRAEAVTGRWPFMPMLSTFWHEVQRQTARTPLLGERFAAARRAVERAWGCHQFEVPLSRLCQGEAFAWFAGHVLESLPRFQALYNATVQDYRRRHNLRTRNRPVPDLAREDDWREAPFWAWRPGQSRRGRLYARRTCAGLELRAGPTVWPTLPCSTPEKLVEAWRELEPRGYKVRTRALTTTLFTRLCLGDVFFHGIGGGIYDELTDELIRSVFDIESPPFVVLSATLLLPLPRFAASQDQCQALAREQRDLWYNPQRHVEPQPGADELVRTKEAWIERPVPTHPERLERFRTLRQLNEQLHPFVDDDRRRVREAADACRQHLRINEVVGRRDYAFCVYPEEMLRAFFQAIY